MDRKIEFKVGLFVILTTLLIASSILYVAYKKGLFEKVQTYTLYSQSGDGLTEGMPVLFSGFKIGKVRSLELDADGFVIVKVDIPDRHTKWVRQTSKFTLVKPVFGTARIHVYTGDLSAPPLLYDSMSEIEIIDDINEIIKKARPIVEKVNQTVVNLEEITGTLADPKGNVTKILDHTEKITANFSEKKSIVEMVLGEKESIRAVHESVRHLESVLKNTDEHLYSPGGTLPLVNSILKDILAKLEKLNTAVDNINRITTDASDSTKDLKVLRNEIDATVTSIKNLSREIEGILSSGKQKEIRLP